MPDITLSLKPLDSATSEGPEFCAEVTLGTHWRIRVFTLPEAEPRQVLYAEPRLDQSGRYFWVFDKLQSGPIVVHLTPLDPEAQWEGKEPIERYLWVGLVRRARTKNCGSR